MHYFFKCSDLGRGIRGKEERKEKRAGSFTKTNSFPLYALTWLPLRLSTAGQERHSEVTEHCTMSEAKALFRCR